MHSMKIETRSTNSRRSSCEIAKRITNGMRILDLMNEYMDWIAYCLCLHWKFQFSSGKPYF